MGQAKRDFGTLRTGDIVYPRLAGLEAADTPAAKARALAEVILETFNDYYARSRHIPWLAKAAFERRDWPCAIELSQERIAIFSVSVSNTIALLRQFILINDRFGGFWAMVEQAAETLLSDRYEADLAMAYLAAVRRAAYPDDQLPVHYTQIRSTGDPAQLLKCFSANGRMTADLVKQILAVPQIDAPFADIERDTGKVSRRINTELHIDQSRPLTGVEIVDAGFYRNRGAYVIGVLKLGGEIHPLALALLHRPAGVEVDAVIVRESTLRHVFSSTLANFHVTTHAYHELVDYLFRLMPTRPRAMHYSTVGYNHVGKMAVARQAIESLERTGQTLEHAPGARGSVAIGFTSPDTQYVLKVLRDQPSDQYKWGDYAGKDQVLAKYRNVHEQNRSGSMLDNIIYTNLLLPRHLFSEVLLDDLMTNAAGTVSIYRGDVLLSHLIVQRKLIPLPIYLENCSREEAQMVVIRLGQCIRNNAATNVFNKDLDGRNYGVSTLRFVYLFDYDAVESLTEIKVRTNAGREDGEEDIPEWYFESGYIFLPEEMEMHLQLPGRDLRRLFFEAHGELLTIEYWTRMQGWLREGRVPRVRTYPRGCQLSLEGVEGNLILSPIDEE